MNTAQCPCQSGQNYAACCQPYIDGERYPNTAEALMRSRYTAYTQANIPYIAATMRDKAAESFDAARAEAWAKQADWQGLTVIDHQPQGECATVTFIARFTLNGQNDRIIEQSEFQKINDRWYYVDGQHPKIGRNHPCPCGSGKKYKQCCLS